MDKKYEEITWEVEDSSPNKEAYFGNLIGAIHNISDIGRNMIIHDISIRAHDKIDDIKSCQYPQNEFTDNQSNSISLDTKTMECVSINGKSPNKILELINYLNAVSSVDPLMTIEMYNKFRKEFTSIYYEAFFHDVKKEWSLDTNEINDIFEYRLWRFRVVSRKLNDVIYWRLIKSDSISEDARINRCEVWESKLKSYNQDEINTNVSSLKNDLVEFLKIFKSTYQIMDNITYRIFTTGFKNIYNPYVDEKYTKITITQINNILKMLSIPYEVVRIKADYMIKSI